MSSRGTWALVALLPLAWAGCGGDGEDSPSPPAVVEGERMLLGETSYEDILYFFPDWREGHDTAVADPGIVQQLAVIDEPLDVLLFVGTWCSDSRNGVPLFMKTLAEAENPNIRVRIFGVDREKRDPNGLAATYRIERVPTFVILSEGQELGRMVETPAVTFAQDLLQLLDGDATLQGAPSCDGASVSG